jgi:hypothetical protein
VTEVRGRSVTGSGQVEDRRCCWASSGTPHDRAPTAKSPRLGNHVRCSSRVGACLGRLRISAGPSSFRVNSCICTLRSVRGCDERPCAAPVWSADVGPILNAVTADRVSPIWMLTASLSLHLEVVRRIAAVQPRQYA